MQIVKGKRLRELIKSINLNTIGKDELLELISEKEAILRDHFRLKCGYYTDYFVDFGRLAEDPVSAKLLSKEMADRFKDKKIDLVVSPNTSAMNYGFYISEILRTRKILVELDDKLNVDCLKNGYEIKKDNRVFIIDSVMTSGTNMRDMYKLVQQYNANVVGIGLMANRYDEDTVGKLELPVNNIENIVEFSLGYYKENPWQSGEKITDYREVS